MICFGHRSTNSFSTIKAPRTVSRPSSEGEGRFFCVRKGHATVFPPKLTFFSWNFNLTSWKKHGISWNFRINQENQLVIWRDLMIPDDSYTSGCSNQEYFDGSKEHFFESGTCKAKFSSCFFWHRHFSELDFDQTLNMSHCWLVYLVTGVPPV